MQRPPHPRVGEGFAPRIDPDRLDDALIILGGLDIVAGGDHAAGHRVQQPRVIGASRKQRRAQFRRERQRMIELDPVQIGQPLHPVVGVLLHNPDFLLDAAGAAEGAGPRHVEGLAQVVSVVLQGLLADDGVPAAGERRHDEGGRTRRGEFEAHRVAVEDGNRLHRGEERAARDVNPLRRPHDTVERRLDVVRRELGAVGKQNPLAQEERIAHSVA